MKQLSSAVILIFLFVSGALSQTSDPIVIRSTQSKSLSRKPKTVMKLASIFSLKIKPAQHWN
jgi:hypothetical protein